MKLSELQQQIEEFRSKSTLDPVVMVHDGNWGWAEATDFRATGEHRNAVYIGVDTSKEKAAT